MLFFLDFFQLIDFDDIGWVSEEMNITACVLDPYLLMLIKANTIFDPIAKEDK